MGLQLLMLTGVRTGELRLAVPEQFDLERGLWIILPVIVPLSQQAIGIVRALIDEHARRPSQRYLLAHRSCLKERISENTLNGALHLPRRLTN